MSEEKKSWYEIIKGLESLILGIVIIVSFVLCWWFFMGAITNHSDLIEQLSDNSFLLKMLTIIFVAVISGYLTAIDKFPSASLAPIYGGIIGYVLGTVNHF